jgi:hypothetical protein
MGEREMFLVLAAMLFFSMTSLSVNNFCINNNETMMKSEFDYYAISLAQGIIEEAKSRFFDAAVEGTTIPPLSSLPGAFTYPPSRRAGEYYPNLTDIDDYHHTYPLTFNTPRVDYTVTISVVYVRDDLTQANSYEETFNKRMTVTVTSPYTSGSVVLSHVYSYYDF